MRDANEKITEQKLREVLVQIQKEYRCCFSDAISMAKMWLLIHAERDSPLKEETIRTDI